MANTAEFADSRKHFLITGGTGYIGERLIDIATDQGAMLTVLSRHPPNKAGDNIRHIEWALGEPIPKRVFEAEGRFSKIDGVIHLAHDGSRRPRIGTEDPNISGFGLLLATIRAHNIPRVILASSLSSDRNALNRYGRIKWQMEQLLNGPTEIAARIGLVYGGNEKALYGTMCRLIRLAPILPMVSPHRLVQTIHIDETCQGLMTLASRRHLQKTIYCLADAEPRAFSDFLNVLAKLKYGRGVRFIPIPLKLALLVSDILSWLPLVPTVDRERILGLAGGGTVPCADDLKEIELSPAAVDINLANETV